MLREAVCMVGRGTGRLARTAFVGVSIIFPVSLAHAGERIALVIGNGAYEHVPALDNPTRDAAAIADILETLSFEVIPTTDADMDALTDAAQSFGERITGEKVEVALVYYAGHGLQVDGENWLIPIDARITSPRHLRYQSLPLSHLIEELRYAKPQIGLVVLDACRNNPLVQTIRDSADREGSLLSVDDGLARLRVRGGSGLLIAYATSPDNVAYDGEGAHSPFSKALLEWLPRPELEISTIFRRARADVVEETEGRQIPWVETSYVGDVYLSGAPADLERLASPPDADEDAIASTMFNVAVTMSDPERQRQALAQLVETYPDSPLSDFARMKLADAAEAEERQRQSREEEMWRATQTVVSREQRAAALAYYVEAFPEGQFSTIAAIQLADLRMNLAPGGLEAAVTPAIMVDAALYQMVAADPRPIELTSFLASDRARPEPFSRFVRRDLDRLLASSPATVPALGTGVSAEPPAMVEGPEPAAGPVAAAIPVERREVEAVLGAGPAQIGIAPALPETGTAVDVEQTPATGVLMAGDTQVAAHASLSPEQAGSLTWEPDLRGETIADALTLLARDGTGALAGRIEVDLKPRIHDCDQLASDRLDPFAPVEGRFPNEVKASAAMAACDQAVAAFPYVPRFAYQLGRAHEISGDFAQAAEWYGIAAERGYPRAEASLGLLYRTGRGVPMDVARARELYDRAAAQGDIFAYNHIGKLYQRGIGVEQDYGQAAEWFAKAAAGGHTYAYNNLGWMHQNGLGVPQDFEKALEYYRMAAAENDIWGYNNLGVMYEKGLGVEQDIDAAIAWYRKAAEAGQLMAQNNLGVIYDLGRAVPADHERAVKWYARAAGSGFPWAQTNLGTMYGQGRGIEADPVEAIRWHARSAVSKDGDAASTALAQIEAQDRRTLVLAAQTFLTETGYEPGPIDGLIGPSTRRAVTIFLADQGDPDRDGEITSDRVIRMATARDYDPGLYERDTSIGAGGN